MMTNSSPKRYERLRRKRRKRIENALSFCAIIVLLVGTIYFAGEFVRHKSSEKTAQELRAVYRQMSLPATDKTEPFSNTTPATTELADNTPEPVEVADTTPVSKVFGDSSSVTAAGIENPLPTEKPLITAVLDNNSASAMPMVIDVVQSTPEVSTEPVLQEQFADLYRQNDDLIGWIHVNDDIDYSMVWREGDNDFYMDHDFNGEYSSSGWIFLDKRNDKYMEDDHLLIYGHNMRLGEMFGELDQYRKLEHVKQNPIIEIQSAWDPEPKQYVLISLFDASMNKSHSTYVKITHFNFETPEDKQAYIDEMYRRSIFDLPCETDVEDQLITLVTCSYSYPNGRFLVVARELHEDEDPEQIKQMFANIGETQDEPHLARGIL